MVKVPMCECYPDKPPRTPGMTHERNWAMEGNRPRVVSKESYDAEANPGVDISDMGLVHRQPL